MKAMFLTGHGGPDMLRLGEAEDTTPAPDEIVVNVHAASVNAADYKVQLGGQGHSVRFPHILGRDFSGVVAATGAEVSDFKAGDPVFGVNDAGKEGASRKNSPSGRRSSRGSPSACRICRRPQWP